MKQFSPSILLVVVLTLGVFGLSLLVYTKTTRASVITVDTSADGVDLLDGSCSLKEAIDNANTDGQLSADPGECEGGSGIDTIVFSGPVTVLASTKFEIVSPIIIDGSNGGATCGTDPGSRNLEVTVDGSNIVGENAIFEFGAGSDGSELRGVSVVSSSGSADAVLFDSPSNIAVACSHIGVNTTGTSAVSNSGIGIHLVGVSNGTIGGATFAEKNVISGNLAGIVLDSGNSDITISGNNIGTDLSGSSGIGNGGNGIRVMENGGTNIMIGGTTEEEGNVVSGNNVAAIPSGENIAIFGGSSITVLSNKIGTDISGTTAIALPDTQGIDIYDGDTPDTDVPHDIIIGAPGAGNIISGNTTEGIHSAKVPGQTVRYQNITIQGNYFGLDSTGATPLSNGPTSNDLKLEFTDTLQIGGGRMGGEGNAFGSDTVGQAIQVVGGTSATSIHVTVEGNSIGFTADLSAALSSHYQSIGIVFSDVTESSIGTTSSDFGNIIGGVEGYGILVRGSTDIDIAYNTVGTWSGISNPNTYGIIVRDSSSDVRVGGTSGEGNTVAGNTTAGILIGTLDDGGITVPTAISVLGNSITGTSGGVGIDRVRTNFMGSSLSDLGEDLNDAGDTNYGTLGYLNHPVILDISDAGGGNLSVTYALDVPSGNYRVEFFNNPTNGLSPTYFGEGEVFISGTSASSSGGVTILTATISGSPGDVITATVTQDLGGGYGDTSEFSNSVPFGVDFGTAPGNETDAADGGAYHIIQNAFLGDCVNGDLGDGTNTDDDGPVQAGSYKGTAPCDSDRDGVFFNKAQYTSSETVNTTVIASASGYVSAWIDRNGNGSFQDSGEQLIVNQSVSSGSNPFTFSAPGTNGTYHTRFRYTTYDHSGLLPVGEALDGEVEDVDLVVGSGGGGGGGGSNSSPSGPSNPGSPVHICTDPIATNYDGSGFGVSDPLVCVYQTSVSPSTPITPTTPVTPTSPVAPLVPNSPITTSYIYTFTIIPYGVNPSVYLETHGVLDTIAAQIGCMFTTYLYPESQYPKNKNKPAKVAIWQMFLRDRIADNLPLSGIFDSETEQATRSFQSIYESDVLTPWGITDPTGIFYKTTRMKANQLTGCIEPPVYLEGEGKWWSLN